MRKLLLTLTLAGLIGAAAPAALPPSPPPTFTPTPPPFGPMIAGDQRFMLVVAIASDGGGYTIARTPFTQADANAYVDGIDAFYRRQSYGLAHAATRRGFLVPLQMTRRQICESTGSAMLAARAWIAATYGQTELNKYQTQNIIIPWIDEGHDPVTQCTRHNGARETSVGNYFKSTMPFGLSGGLEQNDDGYWSWRKQAHRFSSTGNGGGDAPPWIKVQMGWLDGASLPLSWAVPGQNLASPGQPPVVYLGADGTQTVRISHLERAADGLPKSVVTAEHFWAELRLADGGKHEVVIEWTGDLVDLAVTTDVFKFQLAAGESSGLLPSPFTDPFTLPDKVNEFTVIAIAPDGAWADVKVVRANPPQIVVPPPPAPAGNCTQAPHLNYAGDVWSMGTPWANGAQYRQVLRNGVHLVLGGWGYVNKDVGFFGHEIEGGAKRVSFSSPQGWRTIEGGDSIAVGPTRPECPVVVAPVDTGNYALAANGGTATASSTYSGPHGTYATAGAINGDRKGNGWSVSGGWNDGTESAWPDWLEVAFSGSKTLTSIDVFTVQDTPSAPLTPTPTLTFSQYGIKDFQVQTWNGSAWVTVPNGAVTNNTLVWRHFTFPAITTTKIRVLITAALAGYSRITEIEAR